jgi:hypothetical protein
MMRNDEKYYSLELVWGVSSRRKIIARQHSLAGKLFPDELVASP